MQESLSSLKEFDNHRTITYIFDPKTGLRGFIALHRGNGTVPAFGATRLAFYEEESEALRDALKLSRLMSYKAALAGLNYGGGKAVIITPKNVFKKQKLLSAYADKVNMFNGRFITGADVGLDRKEVGFMSKRSPYMVGVASDPVYFTALGLVQSLRVCLEERFRDDDIGARTYAIQGAGKIGTAFLKMIYKDAKKVYISDPDTARIAQIHKQFPKVQIVAPHSIYKQRVDVFVPCALSNALNPRTIAKLACDIVVGGANNQLESRASGELLHKLGVLYAPDYVVNAGGLISVVDEYEHKKFDAKRATKRVSSIPTMLKKVFSISHRERRPTNIVADELAEEIFNNH